MRLFVSVPIPENVCEQLAAIQRQLSACPSDAKWESPAKFHITLKFLGEAPEGHVRNIRARLENAVTATKIKPFMVRLAGVGAFPSAAKPNVIWVGLTEGGIALRNLERAVDDQMFECGFPHEKRPFAGHVTLGRVRSAKKCAALTRKIAALKNVSCDPFEVKKIELMNSTLLPRGSEYTCLNSISILSPVVTR